MLNLLMAVLILILAPQAMAFEVESPAFTEKTEIPQKYTCDGQDISPPLSWKNPPQGAKSLVLISDDPDAPPGTWVHWVIYNLPGNVTQLEEGVPKTETTLQGGTQGKTDFGSVGYGGPCPPAGPVHHYHFKVYALDTALSLPPAATKADVLVAANGHILAQAELVGIYKRV